MEFTSGPEEIIRGPITEFAHTGRNLPDQVELQEPEVQTEKESPFLWSGRGWVRTARLGRSRVALDRATIATTRVSEVWGWLAVGGGHRYDELLFFLRAGPGNRGKGTGGVTQHVGVEAGKETQNVLVTLPGVWESSWTVAGSHGERASAKADLVNLPSLCRGPGELVQSGCGRPDGAGRAGDQVWVGTKAVFFTDHKSPAPGFYS